MSCFETRSVLFLPNVIQPDTLDALSKIVAEINLETSTVERKEERVFGDRTSKSGLITDEKQLKYIQENIVKPLSKRTPLIFKQTFAKVVSYESGGHFGWHSDFRDIGNGRIIISVSGEATSGNLCFSSEDIEDFRIFDTPSDVIIFDTRTKHMREELNGTKTLIILDITAEKFTKNFEDDKAFEAINFLPDATEEEEEEEEESEMEMN